MDRLTPLYPPEILHAAGAAFEKHGYRRTTMEAIAAEARLTRQGVYHHARSKEALFRALVEDIHADTVERALAAAARTRHRGIVAAVAAMLDERYGGLLRGVSRSPHMEENIQEGYFRADDIVTAYAQRFDDALTAELERAIGEGELILDGELTPRQLAVALCTAARGVNVLRPAPSLDSIAGHYRAFARLLLFGAGRPGERRTPNAA